MAKEKDQAPQEKQRDVVPPKGQKSYSAEVPPEVAPVRDDNTGGSIKGNQSYPVKGK
jgi:hypothetical protein